MTRILVVEDDLAWRQELTKLYQDLLGPAVTVMSVGTGQEAIEALRIYQFVLISADILLCGSERGSFDGRRVLRVAKDRGCRGAIAVTAIASDPKTREVLEGGGMASVGFPTFLQDLFPGAHRHFPKPNDGSDAKSAVEIIRRNLLTREDLLSLAGLEASFVLDGNFWRIAFEGKVTTLRLGREDYLYAIQELLSQHGQEIACDELERRIPGRENRPHGVLYEAASSGQWRESIQAAKAELAAAQAVSDRERVREAEEVLNLTIRGAGYRQSAEGKRGSKRVSRGILRSYQRIRDAGGNRAAGYLFDKIQRGKRLRYPKGDGVKWRTK